MAAMSNECALRFLTVTLASAAVGALTATLVGGCAGTPDKNRITEIVQPSRADFVGTAAAPGVSAFLEVRCSSLDCHGSIGRPMRIYSANGLRLPVDGGAAFPAGPGDVTAERNANFDSVIGVQPEELSRVVAAGGEGADRIYLVGKARGTIQHKGGRIVSPGDDGDRCLTTWLSSQDDGVTDLAACASSINLN